MEATTLRKGERVALAIDGTAIDATPWSRGTVASDETAGTVSVSWDNGQTVAYPSRDIVRNNAEDR